MFRKVCSLTAALYYTANTKLPIRLMSQPMEPLHTDSAHSDHRPDGETLSDYVKRMETEGNLRRLAQKLEGDLRQPVTGEDRQTSLPGSPDLSFEKFEEKRKSRGDQ